MNDYSVEYSTFPDITDDRLAALRELIPEAFSEGRVDFEKLRAALGDVVDERPERYSFSWAGKREAIRLLQTPSRATLVPAREESVNWETTQHLFIEGDNLEVLKLLYKAYFGKVKLIYIDPPYNTGNDFVYPDDFADPLGRYLEITGQKDAEGNWATSNPETSGRYHSAWLSMMYPRLILARQLLRDDGVIFVSVDDHESHNLRVLMNEVFGEEQFVADIAVVNNLKGRSDRKHIATAHERLLMYVRSDFESLGLELDEAKLTEYDQVDEHGKRFQWRDLRKRGGPDTRAARPNLYFPLFLDRATGRLSLQQTRSGEIAIYPVKSDGTDGRWRWAKEKVAANLDQLQASYVASSDRWNIAYRVYLEVDGVQRTAKPKSAWIGPQYSTDLAQRAFKAALPDVNIDLTPKAVDFLQEIVQQGSQDDDICLDFFAGSCTFAQAVLELNQREEGGNRRFIVIQLPEPLDLKNYATLAEVGKERIRRVIERQQLQARGGLLDASYVNNIGFRVFKLAPSAIRAWRGTTRPAPGEYVEQMALLSEPLHEGWRAEDVVWEVAIKEGYPLTSEVTTAAVAGQEVWRVADPESGRAFHVCLDDVVGAELAPALGLGREDLLVVRDAAVDDTVAANLALQCRLKTL